MRRWFDRELFFVEHQKPNLENRSEFSGCMVDSLLPFHLANPMICKSSFHLYLSDFH